MLHKAFEKDSVNVGDHGRKIYCTARAISTFIVRAEEYTISDHAPSWEGNNVNLETVKAGLAEVYRWTPTQGQDIGPYWDAEQEARREGHGMWSQGAKYVSPREWRRMKGN